MSVDIKHNLVPCRSERERGVGGWGAGGRSKTEEGTGEEPETDEGVPNTLCSSSVLLLLLYFKVD